MPALVIPAGVQVRLFWTIQGQQCFNVFGGSVAGGFSATQTIANNLGAAIKTALGSSGLGVLLRTSTVLNSVGLRDVRTANQVEYVSAEASSAGTGVTDPLPRQVALCVTLRTAMAGKSYRGRVYIGGWVIGANSASGDCSTAAQTAAVAFVTAVKDALTAQSIQMAILSPELPERQTASGATLPPKPAFATPVTAVLSRNLTWETQRRRLV